MGFVLDASITLAWCFSDEATPTTQALLERLEIEPAFVPGLWALELGNILIGAARKGRISRANIAEFLGLLANLDIRVDDKTAEKAFNETLSLAHAEKLTTYDAAYLELAMRLGLPLASKDSQLCEAANRMGVEILS